MPVVLVQVLRVQLVITYFLSKALVRVVKID